MPRQVAALIEAAQRALSSTAYHLERSAHHAAGVQGALTRRVEDVDALLATAARAPRDDPAHTGTRVVIDQAGDLTRTMGAHLETTANVQAHLHDAGASLIEARAALEDLRRRLGLDHPTRTWSLAMLTRAGELREMIGATNTATRAIERHVQTARDALRGTAGGVTSCPDLIATASAGAIRARHQVIAAHHTAISTLVSLDQAAEHCAGRAPSAAVDLDVGDPVSRSRWA